MKIATLGNACKSLGTQIRNARKKRGLTQAQLAEMVGWKAPYISKAERGIQAPSTEILFAICIALNAELQIVQEE